MFHDVQFTSLVYSFPLQRLSESKGHAAGGRGMFSIHILVVSVFPRERQLASLVPSPPPQLSLLAITRMIAVEDDWVQG